MSISLKQLRKFGERAVAARAAADKVIAEATSRLRCQYCGCTEQRACATDDGPCRWIVAPTQARPGVCSAPSCVKALQRDKQIARRTEAHQATAGLEELSKLRPHRSYANRARIARGRKGR